SDGDAAHPRLDAPAGAARVARSQPRAGRFRRGRAPVQSRGRTAQEAAMPTRRSVVLLASLVAAAPAAAHHGWGSYDPQNPQTLTGTVERVAFGNPHATIWLKTETKTWEVVLAPPFRMTNRGVAAGAL